MVLTTCPGWCDERCAGIKHREQRPEQWLEVVGELRSAKAWSHSALTELISLDFLVSFSALYY